MEAFECLKDNLNDTLVLLGRIQADLNELIEYLKPEGGDFFAVETSEDGKKDWFQEKLPMLAANGAVGKVCRSDCCNSGRTPTSKFWELGFNSQGASHIVRPMLDTQIHSLNTVTYNNTTNIEKLSPEGRQFSYGKILTSKDSAG